MWARKWSAGVYDLAGIYSLANILSTVQGMMFNAKYRWVLNSRLVSLTTSEIMLAPGHRDYGAPCTSLGLWGVCPLSQWRFLGWVLSWLLTLRSSQYDQTPRTPWGRLPVRQKQARYAALARLYRSDTEWPKLLSLSWSGSFYSSKTSESRWLWSRPRRHSYHSSTSIEANAEYGKATGRCTIGGERGTKAYCQPRSPKDAATHEW